MPIQTTQRSYMKIADGTKISVSVSGGAYTDIGVVTGDVIATLEYDEFQEESANAGKSALYAKNPTISGSFTLQNLNHDNISNLASGLMTKVTTAAAANSSIPNQTIAAGWADNTQYELIMLTSSSDSTKLKMSTKPVLTSVTLDPTGTPEVLAENTDYLIVADSESYSGWSIVFMSANMSTGSPTTFAIAIDYDSNTPVARSTYHIGTSVQELTPFKIKMVHTDASSLEYGLEVYECYTLSGSIQYMFKSAAESAFNEMPFSFRGIIDSSLTDGRQLLNYWEDTGAQ